MKSVTTKLTYAQLIALTVAELAPQLKDCVKTFDGIEKAKDKVTENIQQWSKVVAAFDRIYTARLNKAEIPANTSLKDFLQQNAGGEVPGRVLALSRLFNTLVLTNGADGKPLLSEENFDAAKVDHLEKANAIVADARKKHGDAWKTSNEVMEVLKALSTPGDAGKKLKKIRATQKGTGENESESSETSGQGTALPLTLGRCVEHIIAALASIPGTAEMPTRYEIACGFFAIEDAWHKLPSEIVEPLMQRFAETRKAQVAAHMQVVKAPEAAVEKPATQPKPETRAQRRAREKAEREAAAKIVTLPTEPAPAHTSAEQLAAA